MRPTTSAEVRKLLLNRASDRPKNSAPTVVIEDTTATIRLYDPIDEWGGWWGMSAAEMADAVDALPAKITDIRLLINSPGGDVFDGTAIMNILAAHPARVTAVVQGLAASAASFIAVGADELVMNPGSMLMIHDASTGVYGWADDLRQMADLLDKISDNLAALYARKAGGTAADWRETMKAETWYTADEAVTAGLADKVEAGTEDDAPSGANPPEPEPDPFLDRFMTVDEVRALLDVPAAVLPDPQIDAHTGDDATQGGTGSDSRDRDLLALLDI